MVTFKEGWGKLYYTQHTLLSNSNVEQLSILFFFFFLFFEKQTHTHTKGREKRVITQKHITTSLKSYGNF